MKRCLGCMKTYEDSLTVCPHCGYAEGTPAEEAIHMQPGTILYGRYTVGKVLGFGGFGVTYIGYDEVLQQRVAIKEYLPSEFSTRVPGKSEVLVFDGEKQEQFRDGMLKFVDEARKLARFQNEPGIVRIFDTFEENETAYIIMEFLEGQTLTEYLRQHPVLDEEEAISILMPVMQSLEVVHGEGLLHRDIAPDNIFMMTDGGVKLIDFGASRYATTSHSRSLTVIIKPGYSPEEQYRSRGDQGPHTDVYALAATLYRMLTGKIPPDAIERRAAYESKNRDILKDPRKLNRKISGVVRTALLNALNVRIEDRTPTVEQFIEELNAEKPARRLAGKIRKISLFRLPLWVKIAVPAALAAAATLMILLMTGVIGPGTGGGPFIPPKDVINVPEVEGMTVDEAISTLQEARLLASTSGNVASEYISAGIIVYQTPIGGSYGRVNSTVYLTVSSGKDVEEAVDGIATVPYVIWDTKEDAIAKLKAAGLGEPLIEEAYDASVEAGQVISQSLEVGTKVDVGTVLTLTVSLGRPAGQMPELSGKTLTEAQDAARELGLTVSLNYEHDPDAGEDVVLRQSIDAGTEVKSGRTLVLTLATAEEVLKAEDTVGLNSDEAERLLKGQGFKVVRLENYDNKVAKGLVISQEPEGGSGQKKGDEIILYISKGRNESPFVRYDGPYVRGEDSMIYRESLRDFADTIAKADKIQDADKRLLKLAEAEAELLDSAVVFPYMSSGGISYAISRIAPYTGPYASWGSSNGRLERLVISNDFITNEERTELTKQWEAAIAGDPAYDPERYLRSRGHEIKQNYNDWYTTDLTTLDYGGEAKDSDLRFLCNLVDGLIRIDELGQVRPALAESWQVSEDGLKYTFQLRRGVRWFTAEGAPVREVTAADFVAGIRHAMDINTSLAYLFGAEGAHIVNADAYTQMMTSDFSSVGVKATGTYTLEFTLDQRVPAFLYFLDYSVFWPICESFFLERGGAFGVEEMQEAFMTDTYSYGDPNDVHSLLYCGPYILDGNTQKSEIVLTANQAYYDYDNVRLFEVRWVYDTEADMEALYKQVKDGYYYKMDLNASDRTMQYAQEDGIFEKAAYITEGSDVTVINALNLNRGSFKLESGAALSGKDDEQKKDTYLALNNRSFRKALAYAFDRKTFNGVRQGYELAETSTRNMLSSPRLTYLGSDVTDDYGDSFSKGTFYGDLVQHYADRLGLKITVADHVDGWYHQEEAERMRDAAKEELAGTVTFPIQLDLPVYPDSYTQSELANAMKVLLEQNLGSDFVTVNLIEVQTIEDFYRCSVMVDSAAGCNYDLMYLFGWGPGINDPLYSLNAFCRNGVQLLALGLDPAEE